jgi:hypothetical protein
MQSVMEPGFLSMLLWRLLKLRMTIMKAGGVGGVDVIGTGGYLRPIQHID